LFDKGPYGIIIAMEIQAHPERKGAYLLRAECLLKAPLDEVFSFFGDAGNLQRLTPPWLRFQIQTPLPIDMKPGALIDYRIRLRGIPIRWRTRIDEWAPPHHFVDSQIRGPYTLWEHHHRFEECDGGTKAIDEVHYKIPFGWLVHPLLVKKDLQKIFAYRQEQMAEIFS
tara:strand:- start:184 stop:690 length:507 start_codon:yes stop_codon:yes gene_type:complete